VWIRSGVDFQHETTFNVFCAALELRRGEAMKRTSHILNSFDCGCAVLSEFERGLGQKFILYCAKHAAAPDLLEVLQACRVFISANSMSGGPSISSILHEIDAVVAKASLRPLPEGRKANEGPK